MEKLILIFVILSSVVSFATDNVISYKTNDSVCEEGHIVGIKDGRAFNHGKLECLKSDKLESWYQTSSLSCVEGYTGGVRGYNKAYNTDILECLKSDKLESSYHTSSLSCVKGYIAGPRDDGIRACLRVKDFDF